MAHMSKSDDFGGMSAQDATYQWLRQYIATMPRSDGNFITESEVAAALGTSRTPVREALLRLETEGYLQILPKKGAYVPAISDAEAEAVMHARCMVEDWCARGISSNAAEVAAELGKLIEEQEKLITDLLVSSCAIASSIEFLWEHLIIRSLRVSTRRFGTGRFGWGCKLWPRPTIVLR